MSVEDLLREILLSYGVATRDALRSGRRATVTKGELIRTLHDFLLSLAPIHGSAVIIIDEAQHLSTAVLEQIRILSNFETNEQELLQIILVGQLDMLEVLHDDTLRQLDQRISTRCILKPLNREEVEAYISHRLWVARGTTAVTFTPRAVISCTRWRVACPVRSISFASRVDGRLHGTDRHNYRAADPRSRERPWT